MNRAGGPGEPPSDPGALSRFSEPAAAHVIDLATPEWCWARLLATNRGVLSSSAGRRTAGLAVGYVLEDGQVLIPIGSSPGPAHLFGGTGVTLGLAGHGEDGLRWVVRATGVAMLSVLAGESLAACRNSHPSRGLQTEDADALLLIIDRLRGYQEAPLRTGGGG